MPAFRYAESIPLRDGLTLILDPLFLPTFHSVTHLVLIILCNSVASRAVPFPRKLLRNRRLLGGVVDGTGCRANATADQRAFFRAMAGTGTDGGT